MTTSFRLRVNILFVLVLLAAMALISRMYFIEIVRGEEYSNMAEQQYVAPTQNLFERGDIFFSTRDGQKVPAATTKQGYIVAINPSILFNAEQTFKALESIIEIDRDDFNSKASKKNDPYEAIADRVDEVTAKKIQSLGIKGLQVFRQQWPYYPGGSMAAQTLGFIGYDGDYLVGRYGLEQQFETTLSRSKSNANVNFFAELFTNIRNSVLSGSKEGDIVTTIDPTIQGFLENQLDDIETKWESDISGGIVMDPMTGAIYAMAGTPSFDPNTYNTVSHESLFTNPNVSNVYEMGSVIKALTMAAGLDSGAVTPETTYDDKGHIELNGYKIWNWDYRGRGVISMQQVLNQSLNTGASFVALKMGNDEFTHYFKNFGFGEKTGIDLPGEAQDLINNLDSPRDLEHATASFGQGIAMTAISTIRALASLANGGYIVTPHVVKEINYTDGTVSETNIQKKRILKPETSKTITDMLIKVMDEALAHGDDALTHYSIAVKTGTAQIADPEGGYYSSRYLNSFFGYFPAYNPRFIVFLWTKDPKNAVYASQTLTDKFMNTAKFLINYYDLPPDR